MRIRKGATEMFKIGDLIIYSAQGICHIDNICEKTYLNMTKDYYVLHPLDNPKLKISIPVDIDEVMMLSIIDKEDAEKLINSFRLPGIDWIDKNNHRFQVYSNIVKQGNRKEISMIANTLIREELKAESEGKKFGEVY